MSTELFRTSDFNRESASTAGPLDFANVMAGAPHLRKVESSGNGLNGQDELDFSDRSLFLCADDKGTRPKDPNEDVHAKAGYNAFLQGKYGDAETAYKSLLEVSQKNYGKDSKEVAFAYALLGETCEKDKRYEDARAYYKKGVEVSSKASGKDHFDTGMLWHNVAQMDHQLKNWKEAAAAYKSAVDILAAEKNGSENARMNESTRALKGYADVLNQQGDKKGADEQLKRAKEIEKNYLTQPPKGVIYY
jgi:tetratricopeptide (TPR) repeat protein